MARTVILFTLVAWWVLVTPVLAQQTPCTGRADLVALFKSRFDLVHLVSVVQQGAAIVELWVNQDKEHWVIVRTFPNGSSCVLSEGRGIIFDAPPHGDPT